MTINGSAWGTTAIYDVNFTTTDQTSNWSAACVTYLERHNMSETQFMQEHRPIVVAVSRYLPPLWWFIGLFGNLISLLVWLQPKMRHSSGYYLAALAFADLCFLPLNIMFEVNFSYRQPILDRSGLCSWFAIFYLSVQYMSPILVLAFTVERYLSVCHPFRMVKFNQKNNSRITLLTILGIVLLSFALNAVQGWFWTTEEKGYCDLRGFLLKEKFWTIWTWTLEMLVFAAIPFAILVLNVLVINEVKDISRLEKSNMRTKSIDRRSTTLMLLGVSFYQIFTVLPVTVVYSLYSNFPAGNECLSDEAISSDATWTAHLNYMAIKLLIQPIGMSHYAVNFLIYLLTGKIFRKQLYDLAVVYCCKKNIQYLTRAATSSRATIARTSLSTLQRNNSPSIKQKGMTLFSYDTDFDNKRCGASCDDNQKPSSNPRQRFTDNVQARLLPVEECDGEASDYDAVDVRGAEANVANVA